MITDEELRESLRWYRNHYGAVLKTRSVFETWVIGHFRSYPKAAREITERMVELELIQINNGMVEIL